jgi:hypothetical protein
MNYLESKEKCVNQYEYWFRLEQNGICIASESILPAKTDGIAGNEAGLRAALVLIDDW